VTAFVNGNDRPEDEVQNLKVLSSTADVTGGREKRRRRSISKAHRHSDPNQESEDHRRYAHPRQGKGTCGEGDLRGSWHALPSTALCWVVYKDRDEFESKSAAGGCIRRSSESEVSRRVPLCAPDETVSFSAGCRVGRRFFFFCLLSCHTPTNLFTLVHSSGGPKMLAFPFHRHSTPATTNSTPRTRE